MSFYCESTTTIIIRNPSRDGLVGAISSTSTIFAPILIKYWLPGKVCHRSVDGTIIRSLPPQKTCYELFDCQSCQCEGHSNRITFAFPLGHDVRGLYLFGLQSHLIVGNKGSEGGSLPENWPGRHSENHAMDNDLILLYTKKGIFLLYSIKNIEK